MNPTDSYRRRRLAYKYFNFNSHIIIYMVFYIIIFNIPIILHVRNRITDFLATV